MQINPSLFSYAPAPFSKNHANTQAPQISPPAQRQGAEIDHSASVELLSLFSKNSNRLPDLNEAIQQFAENGIQYSRLKYIPQSDLSDLSDPSDPSNLVGFVLEPKGDINRELFTILNPNATEIDDILTLFQFMIKKEKECIDAFQKSLRNADKANKNSHRG